MLKKHFSVPLILAVFSVALICTAFLIAIQNGISAPTAAESTPRGNFTCVVIDAGHGGEDGGAVSAEGLCEKDINLTVAFALRDLLEMNGIPVVMTRDEDILLYDRNVDYQGRKKILDLAARKAIADQCENCLFISIHMNSFSEPQYSGTQVWYGQKNPLSKDIAAGIQKNATLLQPDNQRKIKAAGSNIYLLDKITSPCVLVECGFLSNPHEAERLSQKDYQHALAMMIFASISPYMSSPNA